MAGFGGFSAAFSTGERPVWDSPIFRDLVLGNSLAGGAAAANEKPAEKAGVKQLSDSLGLLTAQLYVLSNSSTLAPALKPAVGRVHAAGEEVAEEGVVVEGEVGVEGGEELAAAREEVSDWVLRGGKVLGPREGAAQDERPYDGERV